jgi:hypothetical protein
MTLALVLAGCYPPVGPADDEPATKPRQEQAVALVLEALEAPPELGAPAVRWREGADLDCGNGAGWSEGPCVGGLFDVGAAGQVEVAWHSDDTFSRTALAHELGHWSLFWLGHDPDAEHRGPLFAPGGAVARANERLAAAGL